MHKITYNDNKITSYPKNDFENRIFKTRSQFTKKKFDEKLDISYYTNELINNTV